MGVDTKPGLDTEPIKVMPEETIWVGQPMPLSPEAQRIFRGGDPWSFDVYYDPANKYKDKNVAAFYDIVLNRVVMINPNIQKAGHEFVHAVVANLPLEHQNRLVEIFSKQGKSLAYFAQTLTDSNPLNESLLSREVNERQKQIRAQTGRGFFNEATLMVWRGNRLLELSTMAVIDEILAFIQSGPTHLPDVYRAAKAVMDTLSEKEKGELRKIGVLDLPIEKVTEKYLSMKPGSGEIEVKVG